MAYDKKHTACFSGHRTFKMTGAPEDLFGARAADADSIRQKLEMQVETLCEAGLTHFLCGMAEGFDLMAAEAVAKAKNRYPQIRLVAVLPWTGQRRLFSGAELERYDRAMASADEIVTVCQTYVPDCFHRRNDYLADNSSALICYYNGTPGGTAYTVRRAVKQGLQVINLL